eukprot:6928012-Prymnesium_polylepis.1
MASPCITCVVLCKRVSPWSRWRISRSDDGSGTPMTERVPHSDPGCEDQPLWMLPIDSVPHAASDSASHAGLRPEASCQALRGLESR